MSFRITGFGLLRVFLLFVVGFVGLTTATPVLAQTTLDAPEFSQEHGFFKDPFQLTLSATNGAQIRYTTDYSTPTPSHGIVYSGPITITGTTVIRAVAYTSATDESATMTQTYLFLAQVRNQPADIPPGWPAEFAASDKMHDFAGPFPADYGMDPDIVNHPHYSNILEDALLSLPSISVVTDLPNLWDPDFGIYYNPKQNEGSSDSRLDPKGNRWERPISIELIDPSGRPGFSENGGARIQGQGSRHPQNTPKKTLRIYFRSSYGTDKLDYGLFADLDPVNRFDRIVLRNGGNRTWPYWDRDQRRETDYVNDEWSRYTWLQMGHLTAHGSYAHLYLNGLYWGLFNVTERLDEKFLAAYLGDAETDYDYITIDEDQDNMPVANAGTLEAFNTLVNTLNISGTISNETYQQVAQMMDMEEFADYLLHAHYTGKTDWPHHNWNLYRKRSGPDTRFRWMAWDGDSGLNKVDQRWNLPNGPLDAFYSPSWMFLRLSTNPEFKQLFMDRVYKHVVLSDGVLAPANCAAVYTHLTNQVDQAVIGESARWGDYVRDVYHRLDREPPKTWPAYLHSRDLLPTDPVNTWSPWEGDPNLLRDSNKKSWVQVRDTKLATYCPNRGGRLVSQYTADGLYQTTLTPPYISPYGGAVALNQPLQLMNPNLNGAGDIYFTTDGSDPRLPGGSPNPAATVGGDAATIRIAQVTRLKARVWDGATWSPLLDYFFYPPQLFTNLVINEIHYAPKSTTTADDPSDYEFIELYNRGLTPLRLDNLSFTRGLTYRFPENTILPARSFLVLANQLSAFQSRNGFAAFGEFRGNLANTGEAIELVDAVGNVIDFVDYLPTAPWPVIPEDASLSLQLTHPALDNNQGANWHLSANADGNPGQPNQTVGGSEALVALITSPISNSNITAQVPITITAHAEASDGVVRQVVFLLNEQPLPGCVKTATPYHCLWLPPAGNGVYTLTVQATDDLTTTVTSAPVIVQVVANQPPMVALTNPALYATLEANRPVAMTALANDSDGAIASVTFYVNKLVRCANVTTPYECSWTPTAAGLYQLTVQATDNLGETATSAVVTVTVRTPTNCPPCRSAAQAPAQRCLPTPHLPW
jgi:hypothetical protein